jgi:hypothetical protein
MAVAGNYLFVAGPPGLIGIDTRTGARLPWQVPNWVRRILATDSALYAVPYESEAAGHVFKIDPRNGHVLPWGPVTTAYPVGALGTAGPWLLVALGTTQTAGSVLLAVDQTTGEVAAEAPRSVVATIDFHPPRPSFSALINPPHWAPASAGLAASPQGILLSSNGAVIGLQTTGARIPWSVVMDGPAPTLYADDRVIVVGGGFATAGGVVSPGVAIFAERVPTAPTNLVATVSGSNVRLNWSPPSEGGPSEYRLEAGSAPGATNRLLTLPPTPSYDVGGVPDGRYYVRVRAANVVGVSPPSNEVEVIVGLPPPRAPTGLTATVDGRAVTLNWAAVAGQVDEYVLDVGSGPGLSDLIRGASLGLTTSVRFESVPPGTYYVRMRALNRTGSSPPSAEAVVVVPSGPVLPSVCKPARTSHCDGIPPRAPRHIASWPAPRPV